MAARTEGKLEEFAEDLGKLLGQAQNKAESWLGQRKAIAANLVGLRDTATRLLAQLGVSDGASPARKQARSRHSVDTGTTRAWQAQRHRRRRSARCRPRRARRSLPRSVRAGRSRRPRSKRANTAPARSRQRLATSGSFGNADSQGTVRSKRDGSAEKHRVRKHAADIRPHDPHARVVSQFAGFEVQIGDAARHQAPRRLDERASRGQVHHARDMSWPDSAAHTADTLVVHTRMPASIGVRVHRENHVRVRGLYLRMRVRPVSP